MSEITNNACRLCLNTFQDVEALNVSLRDIIQIVLPQIDCSNNSVICNNCAMLLQKSFAFKSKCLEIEDSIHDFKNDEQDQVNLEKVLGICTDNSSKCIKICRTCLGYLENNAFTELDTENDFKLVIEKCLPEIDIKLTLNPAICQVCEELLKKIYNFITLCDESNEKIKSYKQNENLCNNPVGVNLITVTNGNDEIYIISDTEDDEEATKLPVKSNIRQRKRRQNLVLSETDTDDDSDYHYSGSDTSSASSNNDWLSPRKRKKPNLEQRRTKMKTDELDLKRMIFCKYCLFAALTELALDIHMASCPQNPHNKEKPWIINKIVQAKATATEISVETNKENLHKCIVIVVNSPAKTDSNKTSKAVEEAEATDSNETSKTVLEAETTDSNKTSKFVGAEKIDSVETEVIELAENANTNKRSNTVEEAETIESNKASKAVEEAEVTDSTTQETKSNKISKVVEENKKTYSNNSAKTVEKENLNKTLKTKKTKKFGTDTNDSDCRYGSGTSSDSSNNKWLSHYVGSGTSFGSSSKDWLSHYRRKKPKSEKQRTKTETKDVNMKKLIFCKYCLYAAFNESAVRVHITSCSQNPYFKEKPLTINEVVQAKGTGTEISVDTKKENMHKYIVTVVNFTKKDINKSVENIDPNETATAVQAAKKIYSNKTYVEEAKTDSNKTTKAVEETEATDSNETSMAALEAEATVSIKTSKPVEEVETTNSNKTSKAVEEAETADANETSKAVEEAKETDSKETSKAVLEAEATDSNETSKAVEEAERTDSNETSKPVKEAERTDSNKTSKVVEEAEGTDSKETSKAVLEAEATDSNETSKAVEEPERTDLNETSKAVKEADRTDSNETSKSVEEEERTDSNKTSKAVEEAEAIDSNERTKSAEEIKRIDSIETEAIEAAETAETNKISNTVEEAEATDSSKSTNSVEEVEKTALMRISKTVEETKHTSSNKSAKTVEKDINKTSKALKKAKRTDSNKTTNTVKKSKTSGKQSVISDHSLPKDVEIVYNEFPFVKKKASLIEIKNAVITFSHPKGRKVEFSMIKEMTIYKEKKRKIIRQAVESNKKRFLPALEVLVCNHCPFNSRSNLKMVLHCSSHSSSSNSKVDYSKGYRTVFYCVNCVKSFWTSALLNGHVTGCSKTDDNEVLLKIGNALHCAKCYFDTDDMHLALQHLLKCGEINTKP